MGSCDALITCLLRMTCESAVLSHVISRPLLSCDRIPIKLQLTGKSRLISQFFVTLYKIYPPLTHVKLRLRSVKLLQTKPGKTIR